MRVMVVISRNWEGLYRYSRYESNIPTHTWLSPDLVSAEWVEVMRSDPESLKEPEETEAAPEGEPDPWQPSPHAA